MAAGGIAGGASVIGNNPIDAVKSRMQGLSASQYKNSLDCALHIYREGGVMACVHPRSLLPPSVLTRHPARAAFTRACRRA